MRVKRGKGGVGRVGWLRIGRGVRRRGRSGLGLGREMVAFLMVRVRGCIGGKVSVSAYLGGDGGGERRGAKTMWGRGRKTVFDESQELKGRGP